MTELTLQEKTASAAHRAKTVEAEKHFYDAAQPFFPLGFSVIYRNPGHWDIVAQRCPGRAAAHKHVNPTGFTSEKDGDRERAFRIRGEPGNVVVMDERWNPHRQGGTMTFRTTTMAMMWIVEELMQEPQ